MQRRYIKGPDGFVYGWSEALSKQKGMVEVADVHGNPLPEAKPETVVVEAEPVAVEAVTDAPKRRGRVAKNAA